MRGPQTHGGALQRFHDLTDAKNRKPTIHFLKAKSKITGLCVPEGDERHDVSWLPCIPKSSEPEPAGLEGANPAKHGGGRNGIAVALLFPCAACSSDMQLRQMVGPNGLEPSTSSVSRKRSNQTELRAYTGWLWIQF